MKKKILLDTLVLDKETISRLDEQQLNALVGGAVPHTFSCRAAVENEDDELDWRSCCNDSCNKP